MEDDTLPNAITYILLLRVESFPKMYVTLCPPKWYHSPPLAHALLLEKVTFQRPLPNVSLASRLEIQFN